MSSQVGARLLKLKYSLLFSMFSADQNIPTGSKSLGKDKAIAPGCQDVHMMDFNMPPNFGLCHLAFTCREPKIVQLLTLPSEPVTISD